MIPLNEQHGPISIFYLSQLFQQFGADLKRVVDAQKAFLQKQPESFSALCDDFEMQATYLLIRARRPNVVVEIGPWCGWSTTWILQALKDNGVGELISLDIENVAKTYVPQDLAAGRWKLIQGDIRMTYHDLPEAIDHLFVDADPSRELAEFYLKNIVPRVRPGHVVHIHDIFHPEYRPLSLGPVLNFLNKTRTPWFTISLFADEIANIAFFGFNKEIGTLEALRKTNLNPMVFFEAPDLNAPEHQQGKVEVHLPTE